MGTSVGQGDILNTPYFVGMNKLDEYVRVDDP